MPRWQAGIPILARAKIVLPGLDAGRLFDKFYYDVPGFVDGTTAFHSICRKHIQPGARILEIGPGPANPTSQFLSSIGWVVGADVSSEISSNPWLSRACVYDGRGLPFADSTFGACVSDYVLEHIEDPALHFREVARVLSQAGVYSLRTPNLWHYVTLASRLFPHSAHLCLANRLRALDGRAHDPYPAVYKANTPRAIARLAANAGLRISELVLVEKEPSYGRASAALFLPMMLYERCVNTLRWLRHMRANIFCVLHKLGPGEATPPGR